MTCYGRLKFHTVPQSQKSTRAPATYLQVPPLPSAVEAMGGHAPNGVVASPQTIPSSRPVVPSSRRPVVPSSRRPVVPSSRRPVVPSSRRPVTGLSGFPLQKAVGLSLAVPTSPHPPSPFQRMVPETLEPWNLASQLSPSSLPLFFFHCVPHCVSDCVSRQEDPGSRTRKQCYVLGVDWITFPDTCVHPVFSYLLTHPFLIPLNPFLLAHPALLSFPFHCFLALS